MWSRRPRSCMSRPRVAGSACVQVGSSSRTPKRSRFWTCPRPTSAGSCASARWASAPALAPGRCPMASMSSWRRGAAASKGASSGPKRLGHHAFERGLGVHEHAPALRVPPIDVALREHGVHTAVAAPQDHLGAVHDADAMLALLVAALARAPREEQAGLCLLLARCHGARARLWPAAQAAIRAKRRFQPAAG